MVRPGAYEEIMRCSSTFVDDFYLGRKGEPYIRGGVLTVPDGGYMGAAFDPSRKAGAPGGRRGPADAAPVRDA